MSRCQLPAEIAGMITTALDHRGALAGTDKLASRRRGFTALASRWCG
jgi:hypothetical protein